MIEADIKGFLNDRTPNDPLFKPLNKQIEDIRSDISIINNSVEYERNRRLFKEANAHLKEVTVTTTSTSFLSNARGSFNQSNMFLSTHYINSIGFGHVNTFQFKISDNMLNFAYLYTDGGSATYSSWKLAGAYNNCFLAAGTRSAMTFAGLPSSNDGWTSMDMSADANIICLTKNVAGERLIVLRKNDASNTAYTAVTVDKQPTANLTSLSISGDGTKIFMTMATAPYLLIYEANIDKTAYTQLSESSIGITISNTARLVVPSFDGSTFALGYSTNTAAQPALDVYRILLGDTHYTKVGVSHSTLTTLTTLYHGHRDGLQISRDGNTILAYFIHSSGSGNYVPIILKYNEDMKNFALNAAVHNNQLWRLNYNNVAYGGWPTSESNAQYRWRISADGNWLFCTSLLRHTASNGIYAQLSVMDISDGRIRRNISIHSTFFTNSSSSAVYCSQHIFWISPDMKYVLKGVIPYSNNQNSSPHYSYYLNYSGYSSYEILLLDDYWIS